VLVESMKMHHVIATSLVVLAVFSGRAFGAPAADPSVRPSLVPAEHNLSVIMTGGGKTSELKSWNVAELKGLKQMVSREKDPDTKAIVKYRGVSLSVLLESAMASLTPEQKAQIDLVILSDTEGNRAQVPRSFIVKYPIFVALEKGGHALAGTAPLGTVVPWTSHPKTLKEDLPLDTYFINHLKTVELANYHERFGSLFLKRRTDPTAMRGEKVFVQHCARCHEGGKALQIKELTTEERKRSVASKTHPDVKGVPKLNDREWRALGNYFDAYHSENASALQVSSHK
jgi:hypothetical protein